MESSQKQSLMAYLAGFVTPERQAKIDAVLAQRTRYLTVVTEDFHNSHNASAILRTCEGLGIQDLHVVENYNAFRPRRGAASGSEKWVTVRRYNASTEDNTLACLSKLRSQGYCLVATSPHLEARPPEAIPLDEPLAIILGSEKHGVSERALAAADLTLSIPMVGFTESFNVSVSAALCLYILTRRLRQRQDIDWHLSDLDWLDLRLDWIRQSARHSDRLEQHFWQTYNQER